MLRWGHSLSEPRCAIWSSSVPASVIRPPPSGTSILPSGVGTVPTSECVRARLDSSWSSAVSRSSCVSPPQASHTRTTMDLVIITRHVLSHCSLGKAAVLGTSGFQRRWRGCPQAALSTHCRKCFDAGLAFSGACQTRVVMFRLIDSLSVEIGDPRLDVPSRYQHEDAFIQSTGIHLIRSTCFVELVLPPSHSLLVAVQDDDQRLRYRSLLPAIRRQLSWKVDPDELFPGTSPARSLFDPQPSRGPTSLFEKPTSEGLVLRVLTEQHDLDIPFHPAHPRATSSESLRPPCSRSGSNPLVVMTPEASRLRTSPASAPR